MKLSWFWLLLLSVLWQAATSFHFVSFPGHHQRRLQPLSDQVKSIAGTIASTNVFCDVSSRSILSTDVDLRCAIQRAVDEIAKTCDKKQNMLAIFFVSSIYEDSEDPYSIIYDYITAKLPQVSHIIGCTTGCPVGSTASFAEPSELESRAGIALTVVSLGSSEDVHASLFRLSADDLTTTDSASSDICIAPHFANQLSNVKSGVAFMLAANSVNGRLTPFLSCLKETHYVKGFGAMASSVSSLVNPKLFMAAIKAKAESATDHSGDSNTLLTDGGNLSNWEKYSDGLVGLLLTGNIDVELVSARSSLPVGPKYQITRTEKNEIFEMRVGTITLVLRFLFHLMI